MPVSPLPPPRLHWSLVLLFTMLTLGIFYVVWMFVQSRWVGRIDPESKATSLLAISVALVLAGELVSQAGGDGSSGAAAGLLLVLAGTVVSIFGFLSMRRSMLAGFQNGPAELRLSRALTVFLGVFYLQHHMTRIARQAPRP